MSVPEILRLVAPLQTIHLETGLAPSVVEAELVRLTNEWQAPLTLRLKTAGRFRMWPKVTYDSGTAIVWGHIRARRGGGSELRATSYMGESAPIVVCILMLLIIPIYVALMVGCCFAIGSVISHTMYLRKTEVVFNTPQMAAISGPRPNS